MQMVLIVLLLLILIVGVVGVVLLARIYAARKKALPEAEPAALPEAKTRFPLKPVLGYIGGLLLLFFLTLATRNSFFALLLLIAGILGPVLLVVHFVRRNKSPIAPDSAPQPGAKVKLSVIQWVTVILLLCFLCFALSLNFAGSFRLIVVAGIVATVFLYLSFRSRKKPRTSIRILLWAVIAGASCIVIMVLVQNSGSYQRSRNPGTNYATNPQNSGVTVCTRNGQVVATIQGGNVTASGSGISIITVNGQTTISSDDGTAVSCTQNGNAAGGEDLGSFDLVTVQSMANSGNATAERQLGIRYENGISGVDRNYAESIAWHQKAAGQNDSYSENELGWMVENGQGTARDYAQAMSWFQKAAAQGNGDGLNNIGWMYQNGFGVKKDFVQAASWYQKAAALGNPSAENNLGSLYDNGQGVKLDYAQAAYWYQKAAAQGLAWAEYDLALSYLEGQGVPKDMQKAHSLLQSAANQGNSQASKLLAQDFPPAQPAPAPAPAPQQTYAAQPAPAQPVPAPQQTDATDSSQPALDFQHCAVVTEKTVNLNGMNDNTLVQVGNSCNFQIEIVAVSTEHRTVNVRTANDPGGGIGWSSTANGEPTLYICPDPYVPVDASGNLPTAPNQTIYCRQVTIQGRQEY